MKNWLLGAMMTAALAITPVVEAKAQTTEPELISSHGDWQVFTYQDNGNKVCYMSSRPKKSEGKYTKRGDVFFFVTHWPSDKAYDMISISTGYPYKVGSTATVSIDRNNYKLFTQNEMAWAYDGKTDKTIAKALRRGSKLVVKGQSTRGTLTTDTYGLKGSDAAYKAMSRECNVTL